MAVLTLLSDAADDAPVLCVIDDAQWLDHGSSRVLSFVARRVGDERVGVLFGVREPSVASELAALPSLSVGGLPNAEARALLRDAVPGPLDADVADRIVAEARGNPLALRELAAVAGDLAGGFAVPGGGEALFRDRLETLPPNTRRLMLVAAAEPLGDPALLRRAADRLGIALDFIAPAEATGLVEIGSRVRFRHPLVRSAIYRPAPPGDRRAAHAALAAVTDAHADPDRRAWHRAQAAAGPDDDVAAELARSAQRARARGGLAAAAAFLSRSAELTTDRATRLDRTILAAEARLDAGEPQAALEQLRQAEREPAGPLLAARIDGLRGRIAFSLHRGPEAPPLLRRAALALESLDVRAARDAHLAALFAAVHVGTDAAGTAEAAATALEAVPAAAPPTVNDLLLDGMALVLSGDRAGGVATLRRALAAGPEDLVDAFPPIVSLVCLELWDLDAYIEILGRQVDALRSQGALTALAQALGPLGGALLPKGRLAEAEGLLAEAEALADALATAPPYPSVHLAALRGDVAAGQALIDATAGEARARGEGLYVDYARLAEAMLRNGAGDYERALTAAQEASVRRPFAFAGLALRELVEAATHAGRPDIAEEALSALTERTRAAGTDWARGIEASSAALLATGDHADALHREAIAHLERAEVASEVGRARLLYGESLRRAGRRVDARAELREAYELLGDLGEAGFAERALRELRATGERARRRRPDTAGELTVQELRIAQLVAGGATSKEVAAELFVSPRTVDAHLRSIFRKLDITSRRQLRGMALAPSTADADQLRGPPDTPAARADRRFSPM
jgi:DNA-binding CsgD family transcriptional regulator